MALIWVVFSFWVWISGFGYLVESLVRMRKLGFKIKEVPLIYSERRFGETKLSNNETFQYGKILFRLAFRRIIDR